MAVNKYEQHVWVVPEDDANRQIANGFNLHPTLDATRVHVGRHPGGWLKVLAEFEQLHVDTLRKFTQRHLVLLIDFDGKGEERTAQFKSAFPLGVADRVYVLGARDDPESLRTHTGLKFEGIGKALAGGCASGEPGLWSHDLLKHNEQERKRLMDAVKPFLFT
jgi:hypothetical protein